MDLNQIRYFLTVAQNEHVTRSAEQLHIAQPALTKAIHRLESELCVPLFVSKGRNIILTEYGKYLKARLEPLVKELDSLPEQLQILARLENDTIHLNVLAASTLVTEALIEYQKGHPSINFRLTQHNESELYDVGVTTRLMYQLPQAKSGHEFVFTEKIFLAVPCSHPLAQQGEIALSEASQEGFISLMGSRQLRWICDRFCQHAGFTPRIVFESDSPAAVKNMIAANMGVGFWPEFTWGALATDQVRLVEIREPVCQRDILFDMKKNKVNNSSVEEFFLFLKSYCEQAARR